MMMMASAIKFLLLVVVFVSTSVDSATISQHFQESPCRLSEEQVKVYDNCMRMIYGRDATFDHMPTVAQLHRIIPCAWNKLGILGANGFDMEAMKAFIDDMPVEDEIRSKLMESGELCAKKEGTVDIMKCLGEQKKDICGIQFPDN